MINILNVISLESFFLRLLWGEFYFFFFNSLVGGFFWGKFFFFRSGSLLFKDFCGIFRIYDFKILASYFWGYFGVEIVIYLFSDF